MTMTSIGKRTTRFVLVSTLLVAAAGGCGRPPQIGADKEAFQAVDALFTAVSLRDPALVDRCSATLRSLRDAGKLPTTAFASLEAIVAEANQAKWEPAVSHLARFMEGQRR
jgi:hypothetical protein